jgi:HK97 gp10 family phage protein
VSVTVRLEGFAELERELDRLGKATAQKASLRRALKKAAQPMVDIAKGLAPVRAGHLRESIKYSTQLAAGDAGKAAFAQTLRSGGSRDEAVAALRDARRSQSSVVAYIGPGQNPQAIFQEFGTINHPPQPFLRPAWDQDKMALLDRLKAEIWADIQRTITRMDRKAAREAARAAAE